MELVFLFLLQYVFVPLTAVLVIVKMIAEGRVYHDQQLAALPSREVLEESIDDILTRYRQERRNRRARQKQEWDEKYLLSLPVEEHPDYFELDLKTDDVDEFVQMNGGGEVYLRFKSRRNSRGMPYTLEIDHITQTAQVSTGKISWEVPLTRVDNWKELA